MSSSTPQLENHSTNDSSSTASSSTIGSAALNNSSFADSTSVPSSLPPKIPQPQNPIQHVSLQKEVDKLQPPLQKFLGLDRSSETSDQELTDIMRSLRISTQEPRAPTESSQLFAMFRSDLPPSEPSLPSISSATSTSSSGESTLVPSSSSPKIPLEQCSTQMVPPQKNVEVKQPLSQPPIGSKELFLNEICLNNELLWFFLESKLEILHLKNYTFDLNGPDNFCHILKFLAGENPSKPCFKVVVQFNDHTAQ
jgi:hypothetical protein